MTMKRFLFSTLIYLGSLLCSQFSLAEESKKDALDANNISYVTLDVSADSFISKKHADENFNATADQLMSDGTNKEYGKTFIIMAWDFSTISACHKVLTANIDFQVSNRSAGKFDIHSGLNAWQEDKVTWSRLGGAAQKDILIASFLPAKKGQHSIALSAEGIAIVQGWLAGNTNNGIVITPFETSDGVDINERELGVATTLSLSFDNSHCEQKLPIEKSALIVNGSFEQGEKPWIYSQSEKINSEAFEGEYAVKINEGGKVSTLVEGLTPDTIYKVTAKLKTAEKKNKIKLYVTSYGREALKNGTSSTNYRGKAITFMTGEVNTSAQIYITVPFGTGYVDQMTLEAL